MASLISQSKYVDLHKTFLETFFRKLLKHPMPLDDNNFSAIWNFFSTLQSS